MTTERPRVVMSVRASADGKIALTPDQTLMQQPSQRLWQALFPVPSAPDAEPVDPADVVVTLEGSNSLVPMGADPTPLPRHSGDPAALHRHFLPSRDHLSGPSAVNWFAAVDGRGRVRWVERHPGWEILVLVCAATPADYLAYLRRERISYLVTGTDRVALGDALRAMRSELGIERVLSTAGGQLQAALLREGLIDEVVLTLAPALVGGADTATPLDGSALTVGQDATRLRLLSVHPDATGVVRLHYEVIGQGL